jgi:hypothetical protein
MSCLEGRNRCWGEMTLCLYAFSSLKTLGDVLKPEMVAGLLGRIFGIGVAP